MDLIQDIDHLLKNSIAQRRKLAGLYGRIPETACRRRTHCCRMLPEMMLIEALMGLGRIKEMTASNQGQILQKLLKYFFLNAVEIRTCPFLEDRQCLIYADRFFGCRAHGLWSQAAYDQLCSQTQSAKQHSRQQWANVGITLPEAVTSFQVPYCSSVKVVNGGQINDEQLDEIAATIAALSRKLGRPDQTFRQHYFLDLSFLMASLTYGYAKAIQLKYMFVKDFISSENYAVLDKMIAGISNVLP